MNVFTSFFGQIRQVFSSEPAFGVFAALVLVVFVAAFFFLGRGIQRLKDSKKISSERKDAVKRSRSVLGGQFSEQLSPYLPGFPCNPGDVRFVGKPIDYIAFPGSAEGKPIQEILFIEVKTGTASLSPREKEIKNAVQNGRVRYVEYRVE